MLRIGSMLLVLIALMPILIQVVEDVLGQSLTRMFARPIDSYRWEWSFLIAFLLLATPMWFFQKRLAKLLVPLPKPECPQCGQRLRRLRAARCPECGTAVPPELVEEPAGDRGDRPVNG